MSARSHPAKLIAMLLLVASPAFGWWDTVAKNWKYPPLVKAYEAEDLRGVPQKYITADRLSRGGKVVAMAPDGAKLSFTAQLKPSTYVVYVVGRSPRKEDIGDPGGMKPFYFHVTITELTAKKSKTYRMRAAYQYVYPMVYGSQEMVRCYFVAPRQGKYRVEVTTGAGSTAAPIWVDKLELRDVLGNCARKRGKTRRTMMSDEALRNLRGGKDISVKLPPADQIRARCEAYWASFPPLNAPRQGSANPSHYREKDRLPTPQDLGAWKANAIDQPWEFVNRTDDLTYNLKDWQAMRPIEKPFRDDGWGITVEGVHTSSDPVDGPGRGGNFSIMGPLFYSRTIALFNRMKRSAADFEKTGDPAKALDATAILLAFAYNYPALDLRAQRHWASQYGRFYFTNHVGGGFLIGGQLDGHVVRDCVRIYDQLFDFIKGNQALADFLATKVPGAKTPDDVVRYLDTQWLQRTADIILRLDVNGRTVKMTKALTMAALCQGANPISRRWIDIMFENSPLGETESGGLEDMLYGSLGRDGLVSEGSGGYSKGQIMAIVEVADMLKRYTEIGGRLPVDLLDLKEYWWLRDAFRSPIDLRVAGGWVPLIGDYGDPLRLRESYFDGQKGNKPFYLTVWRLTRDPDFAYLTHRYGRTVESAMEWSQITAAAKTVRNPLNTIQPRVMDDFGIAVLETGQETDDFTRKKAVVFRYGSGQIHAHNDGLGISVFGKGMRAISDLAARSGSPNPRNQKLHNTVVVDDKSMCNEGGTVPGWGWLNAFTPLGDVQYVDASYRALSHPQISTYRRGVALIDVDDDDAYVFNVARVAGGKTYTFCAHANQNDLFETNARLKPVTSAVGKAYLAQFKPYTTGAPGKHMVKDLLPLALEGKAPKVLRATWRLHPRAEQSFLRKQLPEDRKVFARWRLFGHEGDTVYAANATSERYRYDMSFLYVRKQNADAAGDVYPAIAEVYQGQPVIQRSRMLKVNQAGTGADSSVAIEVKLPNGVTDICLSGAGDGTVRSIDGGIEFDGNFGFIRQDAKGVSRAVLVGGTTLKRSGGFSLSLPAAYAEGEVVGLDIAGNAAIVKGDFKGVSFKGRLVHFLSPTGRAWSYTVLKSEPVVGGVKLKLKERLKIFQAAIRHLDEKTGMISVEGEPKMLKADHAWYDDTLMMNESRTRRWPSRIICKTRWILVKTPISEADIPDSDGDGKRTLKLVGNKNDKGKEGKTLLTLEVTRVDEKARTVYFKMPAEPYNRGGWNYVNRKIVSESGYVWMATYPGFEYKIAGGGKMKRSDFDDANGDGRKVLSIYRFGPGAQMRMPHTISIRRNVKGQYDIKTSTKSAKYAP